MTPTDPLLEVLPKRLVDGMKVTYLAPNGLLFYGFIDAEDIFDTNKQFVITNDVRGGRIPVSVGSLSGRFFVRGRHYARHRGI